MKNLMIVILGTLGLILSVVVFYWLNSQVAPSNAHFQSKVNKENIVAGKWIREEDSGLLDFQSPLQWGSYRPGYYFGLKSKIGLCSGLIWTNSNKRDVRHSTNTDELKLFEWKKHDGKNYGVQHIIDEKLHLSFDSSFIIPDNIENDHTKWMQKIQPSSNYFHDRMILSFYFGPECMTTSNNSLCLKDSEISESKVFQIEHEDGVVIHIYGKRKRSNVWFRLTLSIFGNDSEKSISYFGASNLDVVGGSREVITLFLDPFQGKKRLSYIDEFGDLTNTIDNLATFLNIQTSLSKDSYLLAEYKEGIQFSPTENVEEFLYSEVPLSKKWVESETYYAQRYESLFRSFVGDQNIEGGNELHLQSALSSLLGGIGYFVGNPSISEEIVPNELNSKEYLDLERPIITHSLSPLNLLTGTPSRTSFPRGFLWDEGFHQMVISHWDINLSLDILSHWLNCMYLTVLPDTNQKIGWIPREMILGDDARSRVPVEFIPQRVNIANPPTLLLVIESLITRVFENPNSTQELQDQLIRFLQAAYPRLHYWTQWFRHSQKGQKPDSFRWRGRSIKDNKFVPNTLASGLDDYPRSLAPSLEERHVDIHCWMIKAYQIMDSVSLLLKSNIKTSSKLLNQIQEFDYHSETQSLSKSLEDYHWSNYYQGYYDFGLNNESAVFGNEIVYRCSNPQTKQAVDVYVPIHILQSGQQNFCPDKFPQAMYPMGDGNGGYLYRERLYAANFSNTFIPRIGYVSLFPLLLKVLPEDSPRLQSILSTMEDPNLLWTNYGLRSISASDKFYDRKNAPGDAPYWRGPIWINVNYLALSALNHYRSLKGPYQAQCETLYKKLRNAVLTNVLKEHKETGFFWEHYDDKTGKGFRGHPFTGWTATIVNIYFERY